MNVILRRENLMILSEIVDGIKTTFCHVITFIARSLPGLKPRLSMYF